jgi:hypothetical protein
MMKRKILFLLMGILAVGLALFCALTLENQNGRDRWFLPESGEEDDAYCETGLEKRPVIIPAKRLLSKAGTENYLELKPHVPRELDSWAQSLRMQMIDKVEKEMRQKGMDNPEHVANAKRDRRDIRKSQPNIAGTAPEDYPFLLWRELQLRGDNSLLVNMLLVNNRREGQSKGAIVSQIIPEGWSLSAAWPDFQAYDPARREVKWLFAEAASRENWILQVLLIPDEHAGAPLLLEENTTVRCCMPDGSLMQYACLSLH